MAMDYPDEIEESRLDPFALDPIGIVRRRWLWMLAVLILALAAAVAVVFNMAPTYEATAVVMVASQKIPETFVRSTVQEDPFLRVNSLVGEILARPRLSKLIKDHSLYPALLKNAPVSEVVAHMRDHIEFSAERGIGTQAGRETAQLFSISFEYKEPKAAAAVANALATLFAEAGIRLRTQQATVTTQFLTRELERAESELRRQDSKITEFKQTHRGELPADLEPNLRELERLQAQRQSLALQVLQAESRLDLLFTAEDSPDGQLLRLRAELAEQLGVHTEQHPDVIALRRQIEMLEQEIEQTGSTGAGESSLVATSRRTLEELQRQLNSAGERIQLLEARVARIPERQEQLGALNEKQAVLQATFTELLGKVQAAELAQSLETAQQGERISVIDPALPPRNPVRSRRKFLVAGLLGAIGAAVAAALLLEYLNPVMMPPREADNVEGLPILGSVPWINP
jgi:polysaccharide chain length determinant protein (PEP-CTERM system associated)